MRAEGPCKGHFIKMSYSACWTPHSFAITSVLNCYDHQGEDNVKVNPASNYECLDLYHEVGGGHWSEKHSSFAIFISSNVHIIYHSAIKLTLCA